MNVGLTSLVFQCESIVYDSSSSIPENTFISSSGEVRVCGTRGQGSWVADRRGTGLCQGRVWGQWGLENYKCSPTCPSPFLKRSRKLLEPFICLVLGWFSQLIFTLAVDLMTMSTSKSSSSSVHNHSKLHKTCRWEEIFTHSAIITNLPISSTKMIGYSDGKDSWTINSV